MRGRRPASPRPRAAGGARSAHRRAAKPLFALALLALGAVASAQTPPATSGRPAASGSPATSGRPATNGSPAASGSASAGAASAAPSASAPSASAPDSVYASCLESVPEGATRPKLTEVFPAQGLAGHALLLTIEVEHGAGESVLPQGFSVQARGVEADALRKSGFMVPSPDGGAPPVLAPMSTPSGARTRVTIPLVALPKESGRHRMTVPPLPLAVSRASGEMMTLCTLPHEVQIDDPTANTPDAQPRPNPPARRQREHWDALERAVQLGAVALVAAVIGALVYRWWRRRPRPVPPPPPPRPAWEVALESLAALRVGTMLREERRGEYVDAVSDVVRRYLGDRYGFDGLEATSREVRRALRAVVPPLVVLGEVERLLDEADLVKFARVSPSTEECEALLALSETIVRMTIPTPSVAAVVDAPSAPMAPAAPSASAAPAAPATPSASFAPPTPPETPPTPPETPPTSGQGTA